MTVVYATYSDFTAVYSTKGISQAEISSSWLPQGASRLNEELGGYFTTPFSSNNYTARVLNIKYAYLEILTRNRTAQKEATTLENDVGKRIKGFQKNGNPMILDDGNSLFSNTTKFNAYSTTQQYDPTFTVLDAKEQRVDPDLKRDQFDLIGVDWTGECR